MGRKKIDRTTLEYLTKNLFHKDSIVGFQFTAGNTPLGIIEDRPLEMRCTLNKSRDSVVIDCSEGSVREAITSEIFGVKKPPVITMDELRQLQARFRELDYEVEEAPSFVGEWYWFRIKCSYDQIPYHAKFLKENLNVKLKSINADNIETV